ncbi:MAG: NIPSNAP family protein, partial [Lysobacter sp.]
NGKTWETNWHMWLRRIDTRGRLVHDDAVIELRQYTMQPGQRDALVELFEREFIEPQEAVGIHVIGHFRDLDHPDRYVWLRGFPDMPARAASLQSFYFGPVWRRHRDAANATLLDNDDVLLLKPARRGAGFAPAEEARTLLGSAAPAEGMVSAGICALAVPAEVGFVERFERTLAPLLRDAGAQLLATYVTDTSENTFPRLPVREGEHVFVWFARFHDKASQRRHDDALADDSRWRSALADALLDELKQPPQLLRLSPTLRSELR